MIFKITLTIFCFFGSIFADFPPEIVNTEYGPVKGYKLLADEDVPYMSYRGVQYAEQPIGDLRFEPLRPPKPWTEPFDAKTEGPVCPQIGTGINGVMFKPSGMDEACIHINIHVPLKECENESLPVYIFFHGGSWKHGSGDADVNGPEYLVTRDIILVTVNYRLGIFGFMTLDTAFAPGNMAMKDAVFLLEWIKNNIGNFGGDTENIIVGGDSVGGGAANLLALSPLTADLMHKAIYASGTATADWAMNDIAVGVELSKAVANSLNIDNSTADTIYAGLKATPWEDLLKVADAIGANFNPVRESVFPDVEAFMTQYPEEIIKTRIFLEIPTLIGITNNEGGIFAQIIADLNLMRYYSANPKEMIPKEFKRRASEANFEIIFDQMIKRYFGDITNVTATANEGFATLNGEFLIEYPALKSLELHAKYSPTTYFYVFSFVGKNNLYKKYVGGKDLPGAVHCDDLAYEFKVNSVMDTFEPGSVEEAVRNTKLDLWSSFMKTGIPTSKLLNDLIWPLIDEKGTYLDIDATSSTKTNPMADVKEFYDQIYALLEN